MCQRGRVQSLEILHTQSWTDRSTTGDRSVDHLTIDTVRRRRTHLVVFAEQLHADHGENENDDGEDEGQIPQGAHGVSDDLD